ncbi:ribosome small subunit-dependent GTPase A [candidate division KSB1 bacterium]
MDDLYKKLKRLGWDEELFNHVEGPIPENNQLVRVTAVHKDKYTIDTGETEISAEITGKLMFDADSPVDYPCSGDWVIAEIFDEGSFAIINKILQRKTLLKRKTSGKKVEYQLIAANIDTAFIMQSLDTNYNLNRLERYLVMVNETGIEPVILLSKSDLLSTDELENKLNEVSAHLPDIRVYAFSNVAETGIDKINETFQPGKTYCMLGSSGVGKTTLLNRLIGEIKFYTNEVREKDGKGRHTTTVRQLISLDNGSLIIDTPGMRELGNIGVETGISETFDEIEKIAEDCRFNNCTHINEKGCAVLTALEEDKISEKRYKNYIKMKKESAHNKRTYLEKRRRDKEFGKMIKSVMKNKVKK